MKKYYILKTVSAAVCYFILGLFVLLAGFVIIPSASGYRLYSITSGSMAPKIDKNSVVVVTAKNLKALEENDIITFMTDNGAVVTHRIFFCDYAGDTIITKGDTNNALDSSIGYSQVIGKVVYAVPNIGGLIVFLKTAYGTAALIAVPLLTVCLNSVIQKTLSARLKPKSFKNAKVISNGI